MNLMNKILPGHKYVANFLDTPVRIGMIYRMDDKQFIPAMHFNDQYPSIDLAKYVNGGSKGEIKFSVSKEVNFTFGGSRSSGLEKSEVKMTFKKKRTVAGAISDAYVESLGFVNIKKELSTIWLDKGFDKFRKDYIFVYEIVTAASGTLIYSEESNNEVVLKQELGDPVKKVGDLGSGNFEYVSNKKRTLEIIRKVAHKPLFKAFWIRRNGEPEILG